MPDPITIITKKPLDPPEVVEVVPELKTFQNIVGGLIQVIPGEACGLPGSIDIFCNEEGKNHDLTPNINVGWDILVGPCYFVSHDEEGRTTGLSKFMIALIHQWLEKTSL